MVELSLRVPKDAVEPVSDTLIEELDALSVSVEDAETSPAEALFGEPGMSLAGIGWRHSSLKAMFSNESVAIGAATSLLARDNAADITVESINPVAEQDWLRLTQSQFLPVEITPNFWVVPSWHTPPSAAKYVIRLDPGLAFGTGTHPTTRMCLRWIAHQAETSSLACKSVLDYGCGSGILAIAAAMFGAGVVDAVDIDPVAVDVAQVNALANGVSVQATLPGLAHGGYSLVLANILAAPLKLLAPVLSAHVLPGGSLVLAGVLARQATELQTAYARWLQLEIGDREDEWILLTAHRRT